jgi:dynein heavy chain
MPQVLLGEITVATAEAEKQKASVMVERDALSEDAAKIDVEKRDAEAELEKAKPALAAAEQALNKIKPADIASLKKLGNPPNLIKRIMDGVLLLRLLPLVPVKVDVEQQEEQGRTVLSASWQSSVRMMTDVDFLNRLANFPRDQITGETVELLQPYFEMADFNSAAALKVSGSVAGICEWVRAMADYYAIAKIVNPKKERVMIMEETLRMANVKLQKAQDQLDEKQRALDAMQAKFEQSLSKKRDLEDLLSLTKRRMDAANDLINGLKDERERWGKQVNEFDETVRELVGDVALATAFMSYAGPFNAEVRNQLEHVVWTKELVQREIPHGFELSLTQFLTDSATIGEWNIQGLPTDELSVQNGIIVTSADRYPLLIDPQGQGKSWILNKERVNNMVVTTLDDKMFRTTLENAVEGGRPLLIQDVEEELDPCLDNIMDKNHIYLGRLIKVKVGEKEVDYHPDFRLYITTKLPNPHYAPEVFAKSSCIDFTVTQGGLEQQLLGRVLLAERAELEEQRKQLLVDVNMNTRKVKQLEDELLFRLSNTKGNLVDDETLLSTLKETKITAADVAEKLAVGMETERTINNAREEYRPVATRGSIIYFLIAEMSKVNHMYQTSLAQFLKLFDAAIAKAAHDRVQSKRIHNIIEFCTFSVYKYITRGLFETHKQLFVLQLSLKIDLAAGRIQGSEYSTLIKGGGALDLAAQRYKAFPWIPDSAWLDLCALATVPKFGNILNDIETSEGEWKRWYDLESPEQSPIPCGYEDRLLDSQFHRMLVVRAWRQDRTMVSALDYIRQSLGESFVKPIPLSFEETVAEADSRTPIVCLLSLGADPSSTIEALGKRLKVHVSAISMGQGQEVHARRLVETGMADGTWVLLQNCHLGLKFLAELEVEIRTLPPERFHPNFRLWITSEPTPKFPIGFLQLSIKVSNEAPKGVKASLLRSFNWVTQELLDAVETPRWHDMLYAICFLHMAVMERRKFGTIGWNIPYEFGHSDLAASIEFTKNYMFLESSSGKGISWPTLRYMICEILYGGRVTDDRDRRLLNTFGEVWFSDRLFSESFAFCKGYKIPEGLGGINELRLSVNNLPPYDTPEIFGLHSNADLAFRSREATDILGTILSTQPKDSGIAGVSREDTVLAMVLDLLKKLPSSYVKSMVKRQIADLGGHKYPLNIFLGQEVDRIERVISLIRRTLNDLKLAIAGTIVLSENLSEALDALFDAKVPKAWQKVSWPAASLGFWYGDVLQRVGEYTGWLEKGRPKVFWFGGFFNPQGFLTAMRQEVTRAHSSEGWALDAAVLKCTVLKEEREDIKAGPEEGVFITGLYLEGAAWDKRKQRLVDPAPKILHHLLPVVHVTAVLSSQVSKDDRVYVAPVYQQQKRTEAFYIFDLALPIDKDSTPARFIMRGVAAITSLS